MERKRRSAPPDYLHDQPVQWLGLRIVQHRRKAAQLS